MQNAHLSKHMLT